MKKCPCGNSIPPNRFKFCSVQCVKRAWYLRNTENNSYYNNSVDFWNSTTGKGLVWERWVAKKLGAKHLLFNYAGCDLDWNGKKVDVKACVLYRRKKQRGKQVSGRRGWWVFNRNSKKECDYFACVCIDGTKLVKWYLIPDDKFPEVGATIGAVSKYDLYRME